MKETIEEQASRYQVIMAKMKERGFEDPEKFFAEFDFLKGIYNHLQSAPHPEYY